MEQSPQASEGEHDVVVFRLCAPTLCDVVAGGRQDDAAEQDDDDDDVDGDERDDVVDEQKAAEDEEAERVIRDTIVAGVYCRAAAMLA